MVTKGNFLPLPEWMKKGKNQIIVLCKDPNLVFEREKKKKMFFFAQNRGKKNLMLYIKLYIGDNIEENGIR